MTREKFKNFGSVFDIKTLEALNILKYRGTILELDGRIAEGKESHVFNALNNKGERIVVKIFLFTASEFKNMKEYIDGDRRFKYTSRWKRSLINMWTRKEYQNLLRLSRAGLTVPKPITAMGNIIVMSFIGDKLPAPTARQKPPLNAKEWFDITKEFIKDAWRKAGVVHADLSEWNILNFKEKPVFIDWGSGVLTSHPKAEEFLQRDINHIFNWFNRLGLKTGSEYAFFKRVVK